MARAAKEGRDRGGVVCSYPKVTIMRREGRTSAEEKRGEDGENPECTPPLSRIPLALAPMQVRKAQEELEAVRRRQAAAEREAGQQQQRAEGLAARLASVESELGAL